MYHSSPSAGHGRRLSAIFIAVAAVWGTLGWVTSAVSTTPVEEPIVRVEEDWVLVLNAPDTDLDAPQFHTMMSPFGHVDSYFAQVTWNYQEDPEFVSGGLQLQSWNGDDLVRRRSIDREQLSTEAEIITWTQTLETDGSVLSFSIVNGQSSTWGEFGRDMTIGQDVSLANLNDYNTDVTVENSWITYGANRVTGMAILEVRRYGESGLISVDSQPRIVFYLGWLDEWIGLGDDD